MGLGGGSGGDREEVVADVFTGDGKTGVETGKDWNSFFYKVYALVQPLSPSTTSAKTKRTLRLPRRRFNNFLVVLPSETG